MTATTTQLEPCVSLTAGTLSPDERVNYAYGMVLGLDEFLQEQLHNLSKDYFHERVLHGFGTTSGLHVAVSPVDGAPDFQVSVSIGTAVDQWGREIAITCTQCARIGAWLGAQELAGQQVPAANVDAAGVITVYVTAAYAECLDDMVPLPGQPCSCSDQTMVASRIRDAWDVELSFTRPAMPRWDTDRRLARLLDTVAVVPGLPAASSDEAAIADAVRALAGVAPQGPDGAAGLDPAPGTSYQLPAEGAAAALDRILTIWVTEVRPGIAASADATAGPAPDLVTPTTDARILLSTIRFTPASPFDPAAPAITACQDPDDEGRPYLLHTELIQELRSRTGGGAGVPPAPAKPAVELATMTGAAPAEGPTVLDLWFHLDDGVRLPERIAVTDEDGVDVDFATQAVAPDASGFSQVWRLTAPDVGVMTRDGLQVSALLPAATVLVGDAGTTLAGVVATLPPLLDTTASGDVLVYAEVRAAVPPAASPQRPPSELVTISYEGREDNTLIFEAWFHPEPFGPISDVGIEELPVAKIFNDLTGTECKVAWRPRPGAAPNVFLLQVVPADLNIDLGSAWLRHVYLTDEMTVGTPDGTMRFSDWIRKAGISYVGSDATGPEVVVFSRAQVMTASLTHDVTPVPAGPQPVHPLFDPSLLPTGPARKAVARKATATKSAPAKKAPAKKAPAKAPAKKAPAKRTGRAPR
ncbi:hypothetical protein GCM10028801_38140 [Nocardioides maradonensis]